MKNLELVSCFDVCLGNDEIKDKKIQYVRKKYDALFCVLDVVVHEFFF
jgi:hypothetical protein